MRTDVHKFAHVGASMLSHSALLVLPLSRGLGDPVPQAASAALWCLKKAEDVHSGLVCVLRDS